MAGAVQAKEGEYTRGDTCLVADGGNKWGAWQIVNKETGGLYGRVVSVYSPFEFMQVPPFSCTCLLRDGLAGVVLGGD